MHNALEVRVCLFSAKLFRNIGKFGAKIYFINYQAANTIQLFVAIKGVAAIKNSPKAT